MAYYAFGPALVLALSACGPSVSVTVAGTDTEASDTDGGSSSGLGTTGGVTTEQPSTGPAGSTDTDADTDTDSGAPVETQWCWTEEWVEASAVEDLWTDGNTVLAAAGKNVLAFDGTQWTEHALDESLARVTVVAANSVEDAWFGGFGDLVRLEGGVVSSVALPIEEPEVLSLSLDSSGVLWALARPNPPCLLGPCEHSAQLFHREGEGWTEVSDAAWIAGIDVAGTTVWAAGTTGEVGRLTDDGTWAMVPAVGGSDSLFGVLAVSSSEAWVRSFNVLHHFIDETWTDVALASGFADWSADSSGVLWRLSSNSSLDVHRVHRRDEDGWDVVSDVPASSRAFAPLADGGWVGGGEGGHEIHRFDGTGSVTLAHSREGLGDFFAVFAPQAGQAVGMGAWGLQRYTAGTWSRFGTSGQAFRSVWGETVEDLWAVESTSKTLWHLDSSPSMVDLPVADAWIERVWGSAQDRVFAYGGRDHPAAGISHELLLLRWDGQDWTDISPDIENPGSTQSFDLHGVGEHLYLVSPSQLHHYDGVDWEHELSPSLDAPFRQVRVWDESTVFVLDTPGHLRVFDGENWRDAADVWPEVSGVERWERLHGSAEAGIFADYHEVGGELVTYAFHGGQFEEVPLPQGLGPNAVLGVAEDGSELWADDRLRIWHAVACR